MKKERIWQYVNLVGIPALVTVCGLILLVNPDSAAALVANIVGWLLVIAGAGKAISIAGKNPRPVSWIAPAVCVILGVVILKNPMLLAEGVGRFLGLLLVGRGASDLRKSNFQKAKILAVVTIVVGAVLILTPLTLTRTLLRLCGVVVAVIGVINIMEKLQEMKLLESGTDRKIIDAE